MQMEHDTPDWLEQNYGDDSTGEALDREGMLTAIRQEQAAVGQHGVYTKVDLEECWERTGKGPIRTRLTNVNKGDTVHPEYRARWVAMELALGVKRDDLFAATPPLEGLKMMFSMATTNMGKRMKKSAKTEG